ncbi:MAG TPA: sialidase family protein [Candidatus Thermoplasmatota archaeon]|nr:sialidase family protein [Candidatus Thermoplasmatota archaeon]
MRLVGVVALLLALPALAGCLSPAAVEPNTVPAPVVPTAPLTTYTASGTLLPVAQGWESLAVRLAVTGFNTGEPSLGVTSDGTIFATGGGASIIRSRDHGNTWERVGDALRDPKASLDPWVYVDPVTDRVFNAPLYVACTWAAWSDDGGDSWDANPFTGCGIPAHDHQKLTAGPPAEGVSTSGYPNVLYYSYNSFRDEGTWISVSYDGGRTYSVGGSAHPSDCHGGIAGPVAVAPDGTAYSPKPACDGVNIAVSRDSGASWEVTGKVNNAGIGEALATMTDAAVDSAGNAYVVYPGKDARTYLTRSLDGGKTWTDGVRVSPPDVTSTAFPVVIAGEAGRVAVGYLGTTADASKWDSPNPQDADAKAVWHLYLTFTENATAEDPVFTTLRVTPEDDPVQVGCIWQSGGSNPCRNLLDFFDMVERDGRVYLVFADGCEKCTSADQSRGRAVALAIVETGPSLRTGLLAPLGAETEAVTEKKNAPATLAGAVWN